MTAEEFKIISEKTPVVDVNGQKYSKLIYWLAKFANIHRLLKHEFPEPVVGDWVIETTHLAGTARHGVGRLDALGKLTEIKEHQEPHLEGMKKYTILTLEGKEVTWENCKFCKLDVEL